MIKNEQEIKVKKKEWIIFYINQGKCFHLELSINHLGAMRVYFMCEPFKRDDFFLKKKKKKKIRM